jgi:hypothetical protein
VVLRVVVCLEGIASVNPRAIPEPAPHDPA